MKYSFFTISFLSCIVLLSCASKRTIPLEVMQPATFIFPKNIVNVVVVDNAEAKIDSISEEQNKIGSKELGEKTKTVFMESLVQFLNEENYFNNVEFYPSAEKMVDTEHNATPLSADTISMISQKHNADAIISFDGFEISHFGLNHRSYVLKSRIDLLFRIYDSSGKLLAPPITTADSLSLLLYNGRVNDGGVEFLQSVALQTSENVTHQLVPHWQEEDRVYYTDGTKAMKTAEKHVKVGEWDEAAKIWGHLFEEAKDNKKKAKMAINIALANEYLDDIGNALIWINIADELITPYKKGFEYEYIKLYLIRLSERKQMSRIINKQLGVN